MGEVGVEIIVGWGDVSSGEEEKKAFKERLSKRQNKVQEREVYQTLLLLVRSCARFNPANDHVS